MFAKLNTAFAMSPVRQPEQTRLKILETALGLFHRGSFTATSVNQIVAEAGITKGALFHHFKGKNELGYAVIDELLGAKILEHWVKPLADTADPISDIVAVIQGFSKEFDEDPESVTCGCPLNNMSQELSTVDEVFREKFGAIYSQWETAIENAIRAGIEAGKVRKDVDPASFASMFVALLEGSIGMLKVSRSREHMDRLGGGIITILEGMRPV